MAAEGEVKHAAGGSYADADGLHAPRARGERATVAEVAPIPWTVRRVVKSASRWLSPPFLVEMIRRR